jgi:thiol-disulfide isomerase/thioredoxin
MRAKRAVPLLLVLSLAGVMAGLIAAWQWPSRARPAADPAIGEFSPLAPPRPAPELAFASRDGKPLRLADFRGRVLLVNLWATWCAPCVREMPSLDRLQARLGDRLTVLAISEDRGGAHAVEPFLEKLALSRLAVYLDAPSAAQAAFHLRGLPTSILIDRDGIMRAELEGDADWDSPRMLALLERYLPRGDAPDDIIKTAAPR